MEDNNENRASGTNQLLGLLVAPMAVLLAVAANWIGKFDLSLDVDGMFPLMAVASAAVIGLVPRILVDRKILSFNTPEQASLPVLLIAGLLAAGSTFLGASNLIALLIFLTAFGVYALDHSKRHEWAVVLTFSMVGFVLAMTAGADYLATAVSEYTVFNENGSPTTYDRTNAVREGASFMFFSVWTVFTILGLLLAVIGRGVFIQPSEKGWFSYAGLSDGRYNRQSIPLQVALVVWMGAHIACMWFMNGVSDADRLGIVTEDGYHGYIGFWPPFFTGIVALIVAYMVAERWFTRAMFVSSLWVLYQIGAWYEVGIWSNESFEGAWAVWIWFSIFFAVSVLIYWFSTHEKYGSWMNRELHEPSGARQFWSNHWAGILVFTSFLIGLAMRIQWYAVPSMNAYGTGTWDMTGGSDPWYMKRVVDYILAQHAHLVFDADRSYPLGGINPRPPLFTWSLALGAMLIQTVLQISAEEAVWWSMLALPAIYGALIVFPIASMTRDHFGKGAGVIAAWLIAFMPSHVTHSTWALADHDAFILLFLSAGFMYYLRAVKAGGNERITRKVSAHPNALFKAISDVTIHKKAAIANAVAAGVCIGLVALGWKGFVYGPAIIFLTYAVQVALNMFRRRDSTILSTVNLTMLLTILVMTIPFYAHPQMNLVWNSTGLQPLLFIIAFTLAISFITTGFRDKPWLLVLGSLFVGGSVFFGLLWVLQYFDMSNSFNVLTTGSGYFTKNKIFGTIAEASAPSRGMLFASFGPIVFILALAMGLIAIWQGTRHKKEVKLVLGMWVIIASYMAWTAGRFVFNASPAMAVMGAWGIVGLWQYSGASSMVKEWRRQGIRTPGDRITGARKALWRTPQFSAIGLVLVILIGQHATYGIDSAIPGSSEHEPGLDKSIYGIIPDMLRWNQLGFSLLDDTDYENSGGRWYLGSFGSAFNDEGWNRAYDWLAKQDADMAYSDKPAFVSWWDYGFQALDSGEHPSVSDNFQSGIPATGNMLLARGQDDLVAMFIWQLGKGDLSYNYHRDNGLQFTNSFSSTLETHLGSEKAEFYELIQTSEDVAVTSQLTFKVIQTNEDWVLAEGFELDEGMVPNGAQKVYRIYEDGILVPCDSTETGVCAGDSWSNFQNANTSYNFKVRTTRDTVMETTHYIVGDYWYTNDLVDEFNSVSTHIHRDNARLATITQLLTNSLSTEALNDLYVDLMDNRVYTVQDYEGLPGQTITRNHEIKYFAVDHRLYPKGGRYNADVQFNGGQPTGIFTAPTILSGQDFTTFMDEVYETIRGEFPDEMTREEFDEAIKKDYINQQSGSDIDPLQLQDVRIDHKAAFFDTMLARAYVGYGASSLGVETDASNPQPGLHIGTGGSPGTFMTNAVPMPGAMMNHFVIANWEDPDAQNVIGSQAHRATSQVKILKYYPGAEITGVVKLDDDSMNMDGVRLLFERDAFSDEDGNKDNDTYFIPIGATDVNADGSYSFLAPAGQIRVSAFVGEFDPSADQNTIRDGSFATGLSEILELENPDSRDVNAVTSILGGVSNMTWIGETLLHVSGAEANREVDFSDSVDVIIKHSGASGSVLWTGHESFEGESLDGVEMVLDNVWTSMDNYTLTTTSGDFTTEDVRILEGSGEAIFDESGTFTSSEGLAVVTNFTGNYTRIIEPTRSYFANGTWSGFGVIDAVYTNFTETPGACDQDVTGDILPENETVCLVNGTTSKYIFSETIEAKGQVVANTTVTLVRALNGENFEASGTFEGSGTVNGTGTFIGSGTFSGEIVEPGSFYLSEVVPGEYEVSLHFDDDRVHTLSETLVVGVSPAEKNFLMPGYMFNDTLVMSDGTIVENTTGGQFELIDLTTDVVYELETDETGLFSKGKLIPGEYLWRTDLDLDGLYERNETISITTDSEVNVTLNGLTIPVTKDLFIQLDSTDTDFNVSNRVVNFSKFDKSTGAISDSDVMSFVSNETGVLHAELMEGTWKAVDSSDELYVLLQEIVVSDNVSGIEWSYTESAWVNGTLYIPNPEAGAPDDLDVTNLTETDFLANQELYQTVPLAPIIFNSGLIEETIRTGNDGSFSIRLPVDRTFHVQVLDGNGFGAGYIMENSSEGVTHNDIPNVMFMQRVGIISGTLFVGDSDTRWASDAPGWESVRINAVNQDGLEWSSTVQETGNYVMEVLPGTWTLELGDELLNADSKEDLLVDITGLDNQNFSVQPDNISLVIKIFSDFDNNQTWNENYAVQPNISLTALDNYGTDLSLNSSDYVDGIISVNVSLGLYEFNIDEINNPFDENASQYLPVPVAFTEPVDVKLGGENISLSIPLSPKWLVKGTVVGSDGATNSEILLRAQDPEGNLPAQMVPVDDNGSFALYLDQTDWVFTVDAYENNLTNKTEILQQKINISGDESRLAITLETVEAMQIDVNLSKEGIGEAMVDETIKGMSLDGFMNITSTDSSGNTVRTDENGTLSMYVMPGSWTLFISGDDYAKIDPEVYFANGTSGLEIPVAMEAQVFVLIEGNIFWDNREQNNIPDPLEGIESVNVTVSSDVFNESMLTDVDGHWSFFVPANQQYNVSCTKDGFETVYYENEGNNSFSVYNENIDSSLEMTTGLVPVSGSVTHLGELTQEQLTAKLDGAKVVLYPDINLDYEPVNASTATFDGNQLNWSASVTPGTWIVWVVEANPDENGGGVAIGTLEASPTDGGSVNLTMKRGGLIDISTEWTDFNLVERPASLENEVVEIEVDIGDTRWYLDLSEEGDLNDIILPTGSTRLASTFQTTQHAMGLEVEYYVDRTVQIKDDPLSVELIYNLRSNSTLSLSVDNSSLKNATHNATKEWYVAQDGTDGYDAIEMVIDVTYDGNQLTEIFSASASMSGQDGANWNFEFRNASTAEWSDGTELSLGVGANLTDSLHNLEGQIHLRITPPGPDTVIALDNGRVVNFALSTGAATTPLQVNISIPAIYDVNISGMEERIGVGQNGKSVSFNAIFENNGNTEDTLSASTVLSSNCEEDGWSHSHLSASAVDPRATDTVRVTVTSPSANATVNSCTLGVTVKSENGDTYTQEIVVEIATANLEIISEQITPLNSEAVAGKSGKIIVPIRNTGLLDAVGIEVTLKGIVETEYSEQKVTLTVPNNDIAYAEFDYEGFEGAVQRFEVTIDPRDVSVSEDSQNSIKFDREFANVAEGEESSLLPFVIVILGGLVIFGGYKVAKSGSKKRF